MLRRMIYTSLLLVGGTAITASAVDKKPDGQNTPPEVVKVTEAKPGCCRAVSVNFAKELQVSFGYLTGLGVDIARARMQGDAVGLAAAARSLEAAEAAAGKKASITADEVMRDAVELAFLRQNPAELKAMAKLVSDSALQEKLTTSAKVSQERIEGEAAILKKGGETKAFNGNWDVVNNSNECMDLFVNGVNRGHLEPGQRMTIHIHDHRPTTTLQAICEDGQEVRKEYVSFATFLHWHLR